MIDWITIGSAAGLLVFGVLYRKASARIWYMDSDNAPVSMKAVIGFLWWICLTVLAMKLFGIGASESSASSAIVWRTAV